MHCEKAVKSSFKLLQHYTQSKPGTGLLANKIKMVQFIERKMWDFFSICLHNGFKIGRKNNSFISLCFVH